MRPPPSIKIEAPLIHIPSVFFNRGDASGGMNYGRIEHDALHHVSAAVQAMGSADFDIDLARRHVEMARKQLDRLDEIFSMLKRG